MMEECVKCGKLVPDDEGECIDRDNTQFICNECWDKIFIRLYEEFGEEWIECNL